MQPLYTGWKESNSCFLRIASKAPVRIQLNLYTTLE